jgi:hypothetical protein
MAGNQQRRYGAYSRQATWRLTFLISCLAWSVTAIAVSSFSITSKRRQSPARPTGWALHASDEDAFVTSALTTASAAAALRGQIVVVKYGGNAMTSTSLKLQFCQDVAALQVCSVCSELENL